MAKKYITVGSVVKGREGKPDYIKLRTDDVSALVRALQTAKKEEGLILNLDSKKSQLEGLEKAVSSGKITEEYASKRRQSIEKTPEWVRFNVTLAVNKD